MTLPRRWLRIGLPVAVVATGVAATALMIAARPEIPSRTVRAPVPTVEAVPITTGPVRIAVRTQGTVAPRTESELVAEVSGRIVWASPSLASGGFVDEDEALLRIDPGDYEVAVERAEAALTRAESQREDARRDRERIEKLARNGVASPSQLDDARSGDRVAQAALREARASLRQARRDLERTTIRAPYSGRIRDKHVDLGQFVSRGAAVARIYAVDYAEVRLPLSDAEAALLDLPVDYRDAGADHEGPRAVLRAHFAGREHAWTGRIVRTEGEIDPRTRMIHAVARVEDPYGRGEDPERPPLAVGLFVEAEIEGRWIQDAVSIPRSALRGDDQVMVIDGDDRLRLRSVQVLHRERSRAIVTAGLAPGDRLCLTPLGISVDGTLVRVEPTSDEVPTEAIADLRSDP